MRHMTGRMTLTLKVSGLAGGLTARRSIYRNCNSLMDALSSQAPTGLMGGEGSLMVLLNVVRSLCGTHCSC
jgi:hypothetical protein